MSSASIPTGHWHDEQIPDYLLNSENPSEQLSYFVVSKAVDNSIVSRYRDESWNMKMYDPSGKCIFNFSNWHNKENMALINHISNEMKLIQFARLFSHPTPRKPRSLKMTSLIALAKLALKNGLSISDLLGPENSIKLVLPGYASLKKNPMRDSLYFYKELFNINLLNPQFKLCISDYSTIQKMQAIFDKFPKPQKDQNQQTKLIPSRIYAALIMALSIELDEFNENAEAICKLFREKKDNHLFALPIDKAHQYKASIPWHDAVEKLNLSRLFNKQSILHWKHLMYYINEIQTAAQYWLHLFSGMRSNEARHLPSNTYQTININGRPVSILRGYTSKFSGGNHSETFWVTAQIAEKGVIAAQSIGTICAIRHNYDKSEPSQYPLFPQLIAPQPETKTHQVFDGAPLPPSFQKQRLDRLLHRWPALRIQEVDIEELERFDAFKDWRNDPSIKVGSTWPLTTHQCRRSLAVYSARSGLVSLGTIALQFKQLTDIMASYYRKGSALAINFIKTDDARNWLNELEHERRMAQYHNYELDVIKTTSRLWGGEGNRIQIARNKGKPLIITTDRDETRRKFAKGEMVYKDGPIGGCTNLEACNKISFTRVTACILCEKSILDDNSSLNKINRAVRKLRREQDLFAPDSPFRIQIESEIKMIHKELDKRGLLFKMEAMQ
ncbi:MULTISPECIES: hypothetical protein [unclassified Pseudomonas]|uniref:hypothetical protein n=1 Tax=unclassified Pseudomonas TaxID=196821 RepID=UPI0021BB880B|nr:MULTISPECIES: hypothetical protein [unclassified Pseudomonas]MCT8166768.1 hypothetical protein [Pseudomonas sp. HD6422]MCT8185683.1 hypothetical protein [Pseudomonas sp. HD6421]